MNLLERVADNLTSIGDDAATLLAFKSHAGLPVDPDWTESDALLKSYLLTAERLTDELTNYPLRPRSYKYTFQSFHRFRPRPANYRILSCSSISTLKFPMRCITGTPTIDWTADDGTTGTWTAGTDFTVFGENSIDPQLSFPYSFVFPVTDNTNYPFVLHFNAGGGVDAPVARLCVFEYAAAYYRKPEMAGQRMDYVSQVFDANLTFLTGRLIG